MDKITSGDKHLDLKEEIIELYHGVDSLVTEQTCPIIQFISSHPEEGVSTISREFARIAAERFDKSVLLLDASEQDLSAEQVSPAGLSDNNTIENSPNKGERDLFAAYHVCLESQDCFQIGSFEKAGSSVSRIFSRKNYQDYADLLRQNYDLVLIDSPPLAKSTISLAIASKVDGTVLIMAAETTRWPVAERVKTRIEKTGGKILGVVLNKQKHYIPRFIYRYLL